MQDILFAGGTILTMNPLAPVAEAMIVRGTRIVAVGSEADLRPLLAPDYEFIDTTGNFVMPGMHDAHVHLTQHGIELSQLRLHEVASLEEALEAVAARAKTIPAGTWLLGAGFALGRWGISQVDKHMLDAVAPHHPVYIESQDHHSAWVNSKVLELANIHADTPNPENGVIGKAADGEPTGMLFERARQALIYPIMPELSQAQLIQALDNAAEHFASLGVTTVHHMAMEPVSHFRAQALRASQDDYKVRVWSCLNQEDIEHASALGIATGLGGKRFCIGGAKFFADGALGSRTAWMLEPYPAHANATEPHGIPVHGYDILRERVPLAIAAGLTPVVHAIGDAANRAVLDVFAETRELWQAHALRPRLEHAQHLHDDEVARAAQLGVVVSVQPIHMVFDAPSLQDLQLSAGAYRFRELLEVGTALAFGSDTPVASPDTFANIRAAVTRETMAGVFAPEQALTVEQALHAYTVGAAYAIGREEHVGKLQAGFDADVVVLSHDPREALDGLEVEGTMMAGEWSYTRL